MNAITSPPLLTVAATPGSHIVRARVVSVDAGEVSAAPDGGDPVPCDVLITSDREELHLAEGDAVLLWRPRSDNGRGVILGRIGPRTTEESAATSAGAATPAEQLVIEATKGLTLRCGDGSIEIRQDGRILIKGKDLVSHAQRVNRIRGGSVSIN